MGYPVRNYIPFSVTYKGKEFKCLMDDRGGVSILDKTGSPKYVSSPTARIDIESAKETAFYILKSMDIKVERKKPESRIKYICNKCEKLTIRPASKNCTHGGKCDWKERKR
jgi:hypothetical protein